MVSTPELPPLRWGILSTGRIAGVFARGVAVSRSGRVVAVGSRTAESAARFAAEHGLPPAAAHGGYEALLADPAVEAVYIATPHPEHVAWVERAVAAGKHVLCEKPAGMNFAEGRRMVAAARRAGVLFMEAFMYRCHPQTARVADLVRTGAIGEPRLVQANFGFRADFHPASRLWNRELGGGGILDVGCYPMSFARLVAGAAAGGPAAFADPVELTAFGRLHPETGVDEFATAGLRFNGGLVAQLATGVGLTMENHARVCGTEGWLEIPHPWIITRGGGALSFRLHRRGAAEPETITTEAGNLYALEADAFADALRAGAREVPAMTPDDTLGNLAALDRWRAALGLVYPADALASA
jgi:predicted dehydrogenase